MDPAEKASSEASPPDLLAWEADCMKSLASLAESVEAARSQWLALAARATEAEALLEAAIRERDDASGAIAQLREARAEAERLRGERELLEAGRSDLEAMCAELLDARRRLEGLQKEAETLAHARLEDAERARREAADARAQLEALASERTALGARRDALLAERKQAADAIAARTAERDALRAEVAEARAERDALQAAAAQRERDQEGQRRDAAGAVASLARAQERVKVLEDEAEQGLLVVCDLRYQVNQLEKERTAANERGDAKVRKILAKIHAELDVVGAPNGAEMSFGERIRLLARRAGAAAPEDPAFEGFLEDDSGFPEQASR